MRIIDRLIAGVPRRSLVALGLLLLGLALAPLLQWPFFLSVLILVLYFAYVGQAWNIMMGFAGQLSLGHTLYVGLGAYVAAAIYFHFQIGPWLGVFAAVAAAMLVGGLIGFLGFRFSIAGVYFALLTIAFSEFTRILFDHFAWVGGSAGLFLHVDNRNETDLLNLRGSPTMFYYVLLVLTAGAFVLCRWLLGSRLGYYWLAIREDQDAARAAGINVFKYKMIAVLLSSGMTALAGVWTAFYRNNLFPEQIFAMGNSIEIILAPIIGGIGTLFGPILGAIVLVGLGESFTALAGLIEVSGLKQIFYGVTVLAIVMFLPGGIWPWLARKLGFDTAGDGR